jgi:hypothetical protein
MVDTQMPAREPFDGLARIASNYCEVMRLRESLVGGEKLAAALRRPTGCTARRCAFATVLSLTPSARAIA